MRYLDKLSMIKRDFSQINRFAFSSPQFDRFRKDLLLTELSQKYYNWRHKRQNFLVLLVFWSLFFKRKGAKRSALSVGVGKS
ncbi:MAG: hypothetical protein DRN21_02500 [Thermoplasmata archaeon]|nr:MAG: hypothetical protein DRN21_02500 [Thermoplasmata archaeon]